MKFTHQRAVIRQLKLTDSTMRAFGGGQPQRASTVHADILVSASDAVLDALERLIPGAAALARVIASNSEEDGAGGLDISARGLTPDLTVSVYDAEDKTVPLVVFTASAMKAGKVKLRIDQDGEASLVLRPQGLVDDTALLELAGLVCADVWVSVEPAQLSLFDNLDSESNVTELRPSATKPNTRLRKGTQVVPEAPLAFGQGKVEALGGTWSWTRESSQAFVQAVDMLQLDAETLASAVVSEVKRRVGPKVKKAPIGSVDVDLAVRTVSVARGQQAELAEAL